MVQFRFRVVLAAGAWRKRQRKRVAFSEPSGCKDWGKKATKKHTAKVCLSVVLVAGLVPLAETPRSDVINVGLCRQARLSLGCVRQSVLLSQNGSHPQVQPISFESNKKSCPFKDNPFCGARGRT